MNIGENIKRIRKEKGLTQKQLSELSGVHEVQLARYENNKSKPTLEIIKKIAKALNVPYTYLLDYIIKAVTITDEEYNEYLILKEKYTPKKPIKDDPSKIRYDQTYVCPSCGQRFSGRLSKFCYHCGQALDWSENNG